MMGDVFRYKLEHVGVKAINDSFILESCVYVLLKLYLSNSACYAHQLELLHDCAFQAPPLRWT